MTRRTQARLAIATELLTAPESQHWGYELSRNAHVGAGSMYPFLTELLEAGHLEDGWEPVAEARGRPPRRYYTLTEGGQDFLRTFLGSSPAARAGRRVPILRPASARL